MSLRWFWSSVVAFLIVICSAIMTLSIVNVEYDARQVEQDDQVRLTASVLSDALRMPMMADSRDEVDTLLERFINRSPSAMIYLRWANGNSEQFGAGKIPHAVSSLSNLHLRAAFIKGQERWYAQSINFNKTNLGTITLHLPAPSQDIYASEVKFFLVMIALLLALLGGGLVYRLTGGLSMLMRLLSKASKQLGAGDFSVHIPNDDRGEIGQAFGDFNQMISQLAQRQVTLELFGHYQNPQQVSDGFDRTLINTDCPARTVAVMAIEMVDFSGYMTTARDSGGLSELNRIFSILDNIISANGGHIDHFSGSRLVAVFNHPFNLRNYQDRATIASLAVIEASKKLSLHRFDRDPVEFKVGLAQGEVLTGYLGTGRHRQFKAIGTPVLLAEHLVMLGSGSDVVAGGEILKQLGYGFRQHDLGIRTLAGEQNLHVASILPAMQHLVMAVHNSASAAINDRTK